MKIIDCKTYRAALPDLLLDPDYAAVHSDLAAHGMSCAECDAELAELRATFQLLDNWTVPEPSPFFDARLHARLRETVEAAPEPFWERMRSFFVFGTGLRMRPALAGALGFAMLIGGGTIAGIYETQTPMVSQASPAVNDLKIMDNNTQALQQMDQLLDDSASSGDDNAPPTT